MAAARALSISAGSKQFLRTSQKRGALSEDPALLRCTIGAEAAISSTSTFPRAISRLGNPNFSTAAARAPYSSSSSFLQQCGQLQAHLIRVNKRGHRGGVRAQAASFESPGTSQGQDDEQPLTFARISSALTTAFPVWVALSCGLALYRPSLFTWIQVGTL
jgi:hypothetical protein